MILEAILAAIAAEDWAELSDAPEAILRALAAEVEKQRGLARTQHEQLLAQAEELRRPQQQPQRGNDPRKEVNLTDGLGRVVAGATLPLSYSPRVLRWGCRYFLLDAEDGEYYETVCHSPQEIRPVFPQPLALSQGGSS